MKHRSAAALVCCALVACSSPTAPDVVARPQPEDPARVRIVIPEVYELTNIIIALTTFGQTSQTAILRTTDYYALVNRTFAPFRTHASMTRLQLDSGDPLRMYFELRDASFAYLFEDGEIRRNPAYGEFWGSSLFRDRRSAIQEFAVASGFRAFYAANSAYYESLVARYRSIAAVDAIVDWLEREFAPHGYDHYTVVLSPLVYASHSAHFPSQDEAIFFVSGPDVTVGSDATEAVRNAIVQRILFTEIDHAFVNPTTDGYRTRVNSAFSNRSAWTTDNSSFYNSPLAVFNEYMTWAAFLLFVDDRLNDQDFAAVRQNAVQLMQNRRFARFGAFADELLRLYGARSAGTHVRDLYPQILDWAAAHN